MLSIAARPIAVHPHRTPRNATMPSLLDLDRSLPVTCLVTLSATAAHLLPELTELLVIELAEPLAQSPHRWLGCHLIHWSANHFLWDIAMFVVLSAWCELRWPSAARVTLLLSALIIPLGIIAWQPEILSYRGLSGVDTGLFALLATRSAGESVRSGDRLGSWLFGGLLVALIAKLWFEFHTGTVLFVSADNFVPLPLAHLLGAGVGILTAASSLARAVPASKGPVRHPAKSRVRHGSWCAFDGLARQGASDRHTDDVEYADAVGRWGGQPGEC